ncbi:MULTISPECIES: hypothetical protein [Bacillaceae]|uniref:hypothetical protein n=1 Tax=Bacillaceae TaxID=186817 RepID=UPI000BFB1ABF|nr:MULTISPECIES: hypothetical protein [Bacillaceae]MCM3032556.1 hypothetical protein [Niallia sp. MER 6]PGT80979.1 hypothetical protein COD11_19210 [Bacillus sp. AFS040349]
MKLKITIFSILFVFLFYFSIFIAGFIPFIAEYKTEFSPGVIMDYTKDIIFHPIMNIKEMHVAANPMLYISLGAAFFLFIYLLLKSRSKNYENVGEKYGVQGSSRWAKNHEVFKVPEQITVIPSKNMYNQLKKTLKSNGL